MPYTEEQLKQAVDAVFSQFDKDNSNTLDRQEVAALVNAALANMKAGRQATEAEVGQLIGSVDKNGDGKITKTELYEIFKQVANKWSAHPYHIHIFKH